MYNIDFNEKIKNNQLNKEEKYKKFKKTWFESYFDKLRNGEEYKLSMDLAMHSINLEDEKFTNFFSSEAAKPYKTILELYNKYQENYDILRELKNQELNYGSKKEKRLYEIVAKSLSIDVEELKKYTIIKYKSIKEDERTRIFVMKKKGENVLDVCLIDPYHLGIPSKYRKKEPDEVVNIIYSKNKKNKLSLEKMMR